MFPSLLEIGPLTLHTYGLFVAVGLFVGLKITILMAAQEGYQSQEIDESFYSLLLYVVIGGILGARTLYILFHWQAFSQNLSEIFMIWKGGLVSYGGLFGLCAGFLLWRRKNKLLPWKKIIDWMSPSIAYGHALGRLGCLFAGCCYGRPTQRPWGMIFDHPKSLAPLGIPLHPTQIYEFLFLLMIGTYLMRKLSAVKKIKEKVDGILFTDYLILYSIGRFIIAFFRGDDLRTIGLTPGQFGSILTLILAFLLRKYLKQRSVDSQKGIL